MASKPGILTHWPWAPLGNYKYLVIAPLVMESVYSYAVNDETQRDLSNVLILPLLLWRMIHNQIWIGLSRYCTAKGENRIVHRGVEFEQVDREKNWDDNILLNGIFIYLVSKKVEWASHLPMYRSDGAIMMTLLHAGPVELIYYWLHRALHHHFLYTRYHSHHHSSIVTVPITSVIHPFGEHLLYSLLFAIPIITTLYTRTASIITIVAYVTYIDFMNNMGHCNFELIPKRLFSLFPPLQYLMYTPSFHSLHHTQFRTNYSLFMPLYDYVYGTMDKSTDSTYQTSLETKGDRPDVVYLTHLTTPDSIYHLRLVFPHLASEPHSSKWYLWLMWPFTKCSMLLTWTYGRTFVVERNYLDKLTLQTWVIPRYKSQYMTRWQKQSIDMLIEKAIIDADAKNVKVVNLGLLNQGEDLNDYGAGYIKRNPKLKLRLVDGSSLAVAVVVNSIPKGTREVVLRGEMSKVAYGVVSCLCQRGIKVVALRGVEHQTLAKSLGNKANGYLRASTNRIKSKTWLVGDGLTRDEQGEASEGTVFIPFSQFPPKRVRKDCFYYTTPAMVTPKSLENLDSCENWLARRVMSAWRVGGIVHALEGWKEHEAGHNIIHDIDKVWEAAIRHGFQPLVLP